MPETEWYQCPDTKEVVSCCNCPECIRIRSELHCLKNVGLSAWIDRQREWSLQTFGPGRRIDGLCKHIEKETNEIRENPNLFEWIDVIILALDGAHRAGYSSEEIIMALENKQRINFGRQWPAWVPEDTPSEHVE